MSSKIKNIIIYTAIAILLILIYIFFIKKSPDQQNLVSSTVPTTSTASATPSPDAATLSQNSALAQNFLNVLLSVKSIKLDDSIFSNVAFTSLHDSSITLTPPPLSEQGRQNPFAPIGVDPVIAPPAPTITTPPAPTNPSVPAGPTSSPQTGSGISPTTPTVTTPPSKTTPPATQVPKSPTNTTPPPKTTTPSVTAPTN